MAAVLKKAQKYWALWGDTSERPEEVIHCVPNGAPVGPMPRRVCPDGTEKPVSRLRALELYWLGLSRFPTPGPAPAERNCTRASICGPFWAKVLVEVGLCGRELANVPPK